MAKVWRYYDHVDTDVIIPARYLNMTNMKELAEHAMEDIDTTFAQNVRTDDIIVAGKNFGCGSSREHAPIVLKEKGIQCIIAEDFARIFYRNAINIGLPVIEIDTKGFDAGDEVAVDLENGYIRNITKNTEFKIKPLPTFIQNIVNAGGLIEYVKAGG